MTLNPMPAAALVNAGANVSTPPRAPATALPGNALRPGMFDGLLDRLRETSDAFEARLAALPQEKPCAQHPPQTAVLHVEKSFKAGEPVYDCPACLEERRARRRLRRAGEAGIPADVRHATLENFDIHRPDVNPACHTPAHFLDAAQAFAAGRVRNGILSGAPGIGKGHLAAAIAMARLDAGQSVVWTDCAGLFHEWHRAYEDGATDDVLRHHVRADLLVLDEVCLREMPRDGEEILFAVLDRRHKAGRQTLLLSNSTGGIIKEWIGGRLYDRLKSGGCCYCYGEWESMRGTGQDGAAWDF